MTENQNNNNSGESQINSGESQINSGESQINSGESHMNNTSESQISRIIRNSDSMSHISESESFRSIDMQDKLIENWIDIGRTYDEVVSAQKSTLSRIEPEKAKEVDSLLQSASDKLEKCGEQIEELLSSFTEEVDVDTDNQRKAINVGNDAIGFIKEIVSATDNIIRESGSNINDSLNKPESYQQSLDSFKTILTQRSALERDYLVELAEQDRVNQLILEREKENIEEQQKERSIEDSGKQENVEEKGKKRAREDSEEQESPENKKQKTDQDQQSQGTGSLVEDFADPSLEMPSYTDPED